MQALALSELEASGSGHAFLAAQLPLDKALFLVFADRWGQMDAPLFDSGAVDMWAGWFWRHYAGQITAMDRALQAPDDFIPAVQAFLKALATTLKAQRKSPAPKGQSLLEENKGDGAQDQAITSLAQQAIHKMAEGEGEREIEAAETAQQTAPPSPPALYTRV